MPKFLNRDMQELTHQLTLSPRRLRVEQLRGIEGLLAIVNANQTYPYEFVTYHITKYRKRGPDTAASIPGRALLRDLMTMAEVLSRKANLTLDELGEPCLTHVELARQLQVSTKTVRRWRERGLLGLRVVYPDGVNRLAFCRSTVDRFVQKNKTLVARGAAFRQLTVAERDRIVALARELVSKSPIRLHAAAKLIAAETGRAVETVRYTLRRYDHAHPESALFTTRGEPARCGRHEAIWKCHKAGDSLETIARAFECEPAEIQSILHTIQLQEWRKAPLEYIYNPLFDAPNADDLILNVSEPPASELPPQRIPRDLPPYLRSLYAIPLLSREQEQDLFRKYNYLKFKVDQVLKRWERASFAATKDAPRANRPAGPVDPSETFAAVERLMTQIDAIRQRIIQSNLRLVVSIAKKHVGWSGNFFEVISDGNVSLMRAVEKFDYSRGNKFSTYATWAIMKNYARTIPEQHYHAARFVTGQDEILESAADVAGTAALPADRQRIRDLIAAGLKQLPERERTIVDNHFGLTEGESRLTLEELGKRFGVTKERIRQIEKVALARLREVLAPSLAEAI